MIFEETTDSVFERCVYSMEDGTIQPIDHIPATRTHYAELDSSKLNPSHYGKASKMGVLLRPHEQNGQSLTSCFTIASICFHYSVYCRLIERGISTESTLPTDFRYEFTKKAAMYFLEEYSWLGDCTQSIIDRVVDMLVERYSDMTKIIIEPHYGPKTDPHDNTSDLVVCCASGKRWAVELKCYHRRTGSSLVRLLEGLTRCDEVIFVCPGQMPDFVVCIGRWYNKKPSIIGPTDVMPGLYTPEVYLYDAMSFVSDYILHKRCRTHHGQIIHALIMLSLTTRGQMQRITSTYKRLAGNAYMTTFVNQIFIPYMRRTFFPMINIKVAGHFRSNIRRIIDILVATLERPMVVEFKTKWSTKFTQSRSLGQKIADYVSVVACDRKTVAVVARITMEFNMHGTFRRLESNEGAQFHVEIAIDRSSHKTTRGCNIYTASEHSLGRAPDTRLWDYLYAVVPCRRHNHDTHFQEALDAFK